MCPHRRGRVLTDLWKKGKALWDEFSAVNAGVHASSISYFTFLSLVPLLALCISLVSIVGVSEQEVADFFVSMVPDAIEGLVRNLVSDAFARSGLALSISTITLLWSASKGITALRSGLNAAYTVEESRSAPVVIALSIAMVIALGVLITAVMCLIFCDGMQNTLAEIAPWLDLSSLFAVLNPAVVIVVGVFALTAFYAYLPAGKRRFISQLPGAVLAALGCGVLSFGFRVYVDHFSNYTVLYGSIGTVALLLVWMYLMAYILIAGGFVNHLLAERRHSRSL